MKRPPKGEPFLGVWLDHEKGTTIVHRQEGRIPLEAYLSVIGCLGRAIENLIDDATVVAR